MVIFPWAAASITPARLMWSAVSSSALASRPGCFLIAIGQRFRLRGVRYGLTGVAGALLLFCVVLIATYPRT